MSNEKKSTLINVIGLVIMAVTILVMSLGLIKGFLTSKQGNIVVGVGLFIFWVLSDIVEPIACGRMQDISLTQREAYVKFVGLDLIGYAGVLYFLIGVGANGQSGSILGALIYIVTMKPKRYQRDIFHGVVIPEEEDEQEEEKEVIQAEAMEEDTEEED